MYLNVWIGNWLAYNSGHLVGKWWSCPVNEEAVFAYFAEQREKGLAIGEEYGIFDYECVVDGDGVRLGNMEYASIAECNEIEEQIRGIVEVIGEKGFLAAMEADGDLNSVYECLDNLIFFPDITLGDYAYEVLHEYSGIPEWLYDYIDYGAYARNLDTAGWCETSYGIICF